MRATQTLARMCALWDLGMSMHSNSHLGISLMAMTHVAASIPNLTYACDTHYPWQEEEVIKGGRVVIDLRPDTVQCKAIDRGGSCGAPEKQKVKLKNLTVNKTVCCVPGGGCC